MWIEDQDLYPRTIGADFPKSFEALGGTIVLDQSDASADGFDDFIDKLKTTSPSGARHLVSRRCPTTAPDLIAAARAAGITVPSPSPATGGTRTPWWQKSKDGFAAGYLLHLTHNFLGVDTPEMDGLRQQPIRSGSARRRPTPSAPLGYDTVNLLADAMRRAGSADPAVRPGTTCRDH